MLEIKKILFPVDFTENSKKVLPHVKYLAEKLGARIYLIHVVRGPEEFTGFEMGTAWFSTFEAELVEGAEKAMERLVDEDMTGVKDVERYVAVGEVAEEIISYAEKIGADMIVMGTHGRKGLEKILFGSVARGVVQGASCPVLTINPHRVGA
jgi:nucleotide-binding universal stress UspA family protein